MGLFKSKEEREREKEIERRYVERLMERVQKEIASMKEASPEEAERAMERLKDIFKDPKLPRDYKTKARDMAKKMARDANTRATDNALKIAVAHGKMDRKKERAHWIGLARQYMRKAVSYGAEESFQHAVETNIETIMQTGGVSHHGKATKAKPGDPDENKIKTGSSHSRMG